jgi:hypothetical protein
MKLRIIFISLFIFFAQLILAQSYDTLWTKLFHNEFVGMPFITEGHAAIQLSDGNIVAAGLCADPWVKAFIIKTDANGNEIWRKKYLDDPAESFYTTDMKQTSDGGFIVFGHGQSTTTPILGFRLLKLDSGGNYMWDSFYPISSTGIDTAATSTKVAIAPDGGFVMAGFRGYWKSDFSDVVGDPVAMKADASGNLLWYKAYGNPEKFEYVLDIEAGYGGGYWMCGLTYAPNVHGDMLFLKIDENGNQIDSLTHTSNFGNFDEARSIAKSPQGGYIVGGVWGENGIQMSLLKLNADCGLEWIHEYGIGEEAQNGCVAAASPSGGYLLAGWHIITGTNLDYEHWIVVTDNAGTQLWEVRYSTLKLHSLPNSAEPTNDGGFIVCGTEEDGDGGLTAMMLMRINGGLTDIRDNILADNFYLSQNYPNPFNPITKITFHLPKSEHVSLKIYDVLGNEVTTLIDEQKHAGYYELNFDASSISSGVYFYTLKTSQYSETKKMILMK